MASILTQTGLEKLKRALGCLGKKRAHLVQEMEAARQEGDLAENSAYHQLREDVAVVTTQMAEVEEKLIGAKVVKKTTNGAVNIGSKVKVQINGLVKDLEIVGDGEADPMSGKTSYQSPLGACLIGKKKGESVEIEAPAGKIQYLILEIE